ncbi:TIGR04282 family arsenosugar biosynthesis glycosyltransferase [Alphaproteobacteria bacterium]|mgnify:FL=1|jgi:rSAM/selenodomain-associated transferase 1|nr:TIGR04282 family arsenosugar biosynthesis glycosyltransferase [Alphaproteobacteria bacterium]
MKKKRNENTGSLIVFAKEPRIGNVKTRLATDIGYVNATFWYRQHLAILIKELTNKLPFKKKYLFVSPNNSKRNFTYYTSKGWEIRYQSNGELGKRMKDALNNTGEGPRLLIGSDIPGIKIKHIKFALKELTKTKAVFGPARDGGYWLIGMARYQKAPEMKNVRWSSEHALVDTIRCFNQKTTISYVTTMNDIDNGQDFERFYSRPSTR